MLNFINSGGKHPHNIMKCWDMNCINPRAQMISCIGKEMVNTYFKLCFRENHSKCLSYAGECHIYMLWYSCVLLRQKMHFKKWNQYAYLEFSVKLLFLKHLLRFTLMLTTNWTIWWNLWNCEPRPGTTCNNSNRNHFLAETQAAFGRNCSFLLILNSFKINSTNMVAGRSLQEKRLLESYII